MLGLLPDDCPNPVVPTGRCQECLSYCDFVSEIRRRVSVSGGLYAQADYFWKLSDAFLESSYQLYLKTCTMFSFTDILGKSLITSCLGELQKECITVCGESYSRYTINPCSCSEKTFSSEFYKKVILLTRLTKYPSRLLYDRIETLFGYVFIYQPQGIYVIVSDPYEFFAIASLIPVPLGESIQPLVKGCP